MMGSNVSDTKLKPATKKPATRKATPHAPELTKDDVYLFGIGTWERSWEKMGAHPDTQNRTRGWRFCVWAPDVKSVHVIGEFNNWDEQANPLAPMHTSAIWEGFIPGAEQGQLYKYLIETNEGEKLYKADPYAFKAECPPGTASVLWTLDGYQWNDAAWLKRRASHNHMSQPLNIYEVHIGSWKRHGDAPQGEPDEYGNYPGPMDPFPAQRGEFYTYDELSWSSWTTCATWATRTSRSCHSWSIPSMAPGATRRPAITPPRRVTATRSSSCTLSMRATRRASA